jgi:hypothetical protein
MMDPIVALLKRAETTKIPALPSDVIAAGGAQTSDRNVLVDKRAEASQGKTALQKLKGKLCTTSAGTFI